jgi:hypothetical protein
MFRKWFWGKTFLLCTPTLHGLRLQNLGIIADDRIDMEHIKHQGEYEYMTNIENNPNKKR